MAFESMVVEYDSQLPSRRQRRVLVDDFEPMSLPASQVWSSTTRDHFLHLYRRTSSAAL